MTVVGIRKADKKKLAFVESMDYSKDKEESDLHALIERNPELVYLSTPGEEEIKLPIMTLASKLKVAGGELDLLLVDVKGRLYLVELKREQAPRDTIAQILDYASCLSEMNNYDFEDLIKEKTIFKNGFVDIFNKFKEDYPGITESEDENTNIESFLKNIKKNLSGTELQLIVLSYNIDQSTRRITNFLRDETGLQIYCIEFEYFRDSSNNEIFVPRVIGLEEVKKKKKKEASEKSDLQKEYYKFFDNVLSNFKVVKPGITERSSTYDSYCGVPVGVTGIHFEWRFVGRKPNKWLQTELHFERSDKKENYELLEYFKNFSKEIREEIGSDLRFEKWGKNWARIYTEREAQDLESEDLKKWAVDMMVKFYDVLKPKLDEYFRK